MSKGQRGNKEAKKPKKARPLLEGGPPVAQIPAQGVTAPAPGRKRR